MPLRPLSARAGRGPHPDQRHRSGWPRLPGASPRRPPSPRAGPRRGRLPGRGRPGSGEAGAGCCSGRWPSAPHAGQTAMLGPVQADNERGIRFLHALARWRRPVRRRRRQVEVVVPVPPAVRATQEGGVMRSAGPDVAVRRCPPFAGYARLNRPPRSPTPTGSWCCPGPRWPRPAAAPTRCWCSCPARPTWRARRTAGRRSVPAPSSAPAGLSDDPPATRSSPGAAWPPSSSPVPPSGGPCSRSGPARPARARRRRRPRGSGPGRPRHGGGVTLTASHAAPEQQVQPDQMALMITVDTTKPGVSPEPGNRTFIPLVAGDEGGGGRSPPSSRRSSSPGSGGGRAGQVRLDQRTHDGPEPVGRLIHHQDVVVEVHQ